MLVDKSTGEIFLYHPIGADIYGDGVTAETMIQALDTIGTRKRAIVRINSPGGSVFDGVAIYNALKRHPGGVDVVIDALAASIASIIALAGTTRTSSKGSGDKTLVGIYAEVMNKSPKEIESMMSAETWFTAEEAVSIGLATKAEGSMKQAPKVAAWFNNAPQAIRAQVASSNTPKVPVYRYVSPFGKSEDN